MSETLSRKKTTLKKQQRQFRRAKKNEKEDAARALRELETTVQGTEAARDSLLCTDCAHRGECMSRFQKLQKAQRTANRLVQRKETIEHLTPDEVERRIAFLASLGYFQHRRLTSKGQCASRLYGYEIQTTELLFDGYFDRLDEVEVNVLAAAISFESRSDTTYKRLEPKHLDFDFETLDRRMQRLAERQRAFGIERQFKMLDTSLSRVVHAWSNGCEFSDLAKYTDAAEGDLIRGLRRVINLLRQLADALPQETVLCDKIGRCIGRMKRGVVDAENQLSL